MVLVLNLLLDTLENADGGRVVVDTTAGTESGLDYLGRRNKVVSEAVVKTTLELEKVLDGVEETNVTGVESVKGLLLVVGGVATDWSE